MELWNIYFVAKLILYFGHHIGFHWLPNLAFAVVLLIPLRLRWQRAIRQIAALPLGVALLYYDSWLPPIGRVISQMPALSAFTPGYLAELAGRFVNPWVVAGLCIAVLIYQLVKDRLRVTTFVLLGILAVPLALRAPQPVGPAHNTSAAAGKSATDDGAPLGAAQLDQALTAFYKQQAELKVAIGPIGDNKVPFDILILHVCSLAWDDLVVAGQKDAALFKHFDILFDDFNSAASYSGPAGIRVLRASCGQTPHDGLYRQPARDCYLFDQLQQAGFETALLMNHDGKFGNFIDDLHQRGGLKMAPLGNLGATPHMRAFDGSPIYSDFDILSHWLEQRKQSPAMRTALFYSTISLHDGNIVDWSKSRSSLDTYGPRLQQLLEDMDRFVTELERQGRRAIVVFVPEHGANLRGDSMQIPGMREIPGPQITRVPVGIKLVGLKSVPGSAPQVVSSPSSYLALAELLARFIARNPFEEEVPDLQAYLSGLPQTEFVAENDKTVVVRHGSRYYIRMPDGSWSDFQ